MCGRFQLVFLQEDAQRIEAEHRESVSRNKLCAVPAGRTMWAINNSDGTCQTTATVTITVNSAYDPPQSVDDGYASPADALVIINALSATGERILTGSPPYGANFLSVSYLDVSGDGVLSVVDANQVIDYLNGNDSTAGTAGAPWRNPSQPQDVNNDGAVTLADQQSVEGYLMLGAIDYTALALDQIHIRTHGGDDTVAVDGAIAWLFGGAGDNTLTGGSFDNYISAVDGNNTITGGSGQNTIEVGDGNNIITAGDAGDVVFAGNGSNTIYGGDGGDYVQVGDGNNMVTGGNASNTIIAGDGENLIAAGNGGDYISVGDGDNSIEGGQGGDTIDTGSGTNEISSADGSDEIDGIVDRPAVQLYADDEVLEGNQLLVGVWLTAATHHDVTATLNLTGEPGISGPSRWATTQMAVVIPAGQLYTVISVPTVDDGLMNGTNVSTISLTNLDGADPGYVASATVIVIDNDEGIGLSWYIPLEENSDSAFDDDVRATTNSDGTLDAEGVDDHGRRFHAHVTIDRTTFEQTIDLTIAGLPPEDDHWTGTSVGHEEYNGRFPMYSDSGNGGGLFTALLAAEPTQGRVPGLCYPTTVDGKERVFESEDAAAHDWGMTFNLASIQSGIEFSSTIYKTSAGKYSYSKPNDTREKGSTPFNSFPSFAPDNCTAVAHIHSHRNYQAGYKGNDFSTNDKRGSRQAGLDDYLTTPSGKLRRYDPSTGRNDVIATDLRFDPNDPTSPRKKKY